MKKKMSGKRKSSDLLKRELLKKSVWGIPTVMFFLDMMKVKAHAQTPSGDSGDPGDIGAPRFGRIREEKKRNKTRLRPLEIDVWENNHWKRSGRFWKDPLRNKDSSSDD